MDIFWHRKLTLKVRILPFLTTFVQLSARLKNFLGGWLLVLGIKEGLVECATVCVKSVVILTLKVGTYNGAIVFTNSNSKVLRFFEIFSLLSFYLENKNRVNISWIWKHLEFMKLNNNSKRIRPQCATVIWSFRDAPWARATKNVKKPQRQKFESCRTACFEIFVKQNRKIFGFSHTFYSEVFYCSK